MQIVVKNGIVRCVHHDDVVHAIVPLLDVSAVDVRRAGHVDPVPGTLRWRVDLRPIGGEVHETDEQGQVFTTRRAALAFEHRHVQKALPRL